MSAQKLRTSEIRVSLLILDRLHYGNWCAYHDLAEMQQIDAEEVNACMEWLIVRQLVDRDPTDHGFVRVTQRGWQIWRRLRKPDFSSYANLIQRYFNEYELNTLLHVSGQHACTIRTLLSESGVVFRRRTAKLRIYRWHEKTPVHVTCFRLSVDDETHSALFDQVFASYWAVRRNYLTDSPCLLQQQ